MFSLFKNNINVDAIKHSAVEQYKQSLEGRKQLGLVVDASRADCGVCVFNFNDPEIVVFSIERVAHNTEDERTVIGYYFKRDLKNADERAPEENKKVIHQWYLVCSRENHAQLVEEWKGVSECSKPKQVIKG